MSWSRAPGDEGGPPRRARRWETPSLRRVVVLAAGISLLVVEWFATTRAFERTVESIHTVVDNAMPSISYLAAVQGTVSELAREVRQLEATSGRARVARARREVEVVLRSMRRLLLEYEQFPVYPNEPEARRELRTALEALAVRAREVIEEPDATRREERTREEFYPALEGANAVVRDLLRFNADQATRSARSTIAAHDSAVLRSLLLTLSLNGVLVLLWVLLGRQISRTERERERRLRELDAFAGRVAHDLRAPLATIVMSCGSLRRAPDLPGPLLRALDRIGRASDRMSRLIEGLLAFAKAGAAVAGETRASVQQVLADLRATIAPTLQAERVELTVECPPDLWARASEGVLGSIAQNLIRNAVTHMGEVERREVRVRARPLSGSALELEVADTGPGIPADVQRRLFIPFERGSTSAEGHGLGLATVKRLVEAHQGKIELETELGRGTTFRVRLPRATPPPG